MKTFLKLFIAFQIILTQAFAQVSNISNNSHRPELSQQGHLVSIQIAPGKPIKIFVVGREEAQLDLSQFELVVWRLSPNRKVKMNVEKAADYFTIDPASLQNSQDLEIHAITKGKEESFHFKIDGKLR